jgi:hypothetical protein
LDGFNFIVCFLGKAVVWACGGSAQVWLSEKKILSGFQHAIVQVVKRTDLATGRS